MRHLIIYIVCLFFSTSLHAQQPISCEEHESSDCCHKQQQRPNKCNEGIGEAARQYNPKTLIIFYDGKKGHKALKKAVKKTKAEVIYDYNSFKAMAIKKPDSMTLEQAINFFSKVKGVLQVTKDAIYHID